MYTFILLIFFIISVILICFIMLQQEKTADIKSSFVTNNANNLFTPRNTESLINKIIKILATLFILTSLILNNLNNFNIKNNKWENLNISRSNNTKK